MPECARSVAGPWRPTRRRTARFAVSARRKAFSRWNATWTRSPRALDLTPEEFRRRNFIHKGQTTATGQVIHEDVNLDALLDRALARERLSRQARTFRARKSRRNDQARHRLRVLHARSGVYRLGRSVPGIRGGTSRPRAEGNVRVLAASTEIGQGTNTIFSQIAADALGIGYDRIEIAQPDTGAVPNSGPTVASRTCMVVGNLVETAALAIKQTLLDSGLLCDACTEDEFVRACGEIHRDARAASFARAVRSAAGIILGRRRRISGDAYGTYAWAVYVAEVAVDTVTFEARVTILSRCRKSAR